MSEEIETTRDKVIRNEHLIQACTDLREVGPGEEVFVAPSPQDPSAQRVRVDGLQIVALFLPKNGTVHMKFNTKAGDFEARCSALRAEELARELPLYVESLEDPAPSALSPPEDLVSAVMTQRLGFDVVVESLAKYQRSGAPQSLYEFEGMNADQAKAMENRDVVRQYDQKQAWFYIGEGVWVVSFPAADEGLVMQTIEQHRGSLQDEDVREVVVEKLERAISGRVQLFPVVHLALNGEARAPGWDAPGDDADRIAEALRIFENGGTSFDMARALNGEDVSDARWATRSREVGNLLERLRGTDAICAELAERIDTAVNLASNHEGEDDVKYIVEPLLGSTVATYSQATVSLVKLLRANGVTDDKIAQFVASMLIEMGCKEPRVSLNSRPGSDQPRLRVSWSHERELSFECDVD